MAESDDFVQLKETHLAQCVALDSQAHRDAWDLPRYRACLEAPYLGFVCISATQTLDALIILQKGVEELHLLQLVVAPERRRQGLAQTALQLAQKQGQQLGFKHIWLELRASNHAALKLYQFFGFVQVGERKNYYTAQPFAYQRGVQRENALLLSLNLPPY